MKLENWIDVEQNTNDWHLLRAGKIGSSSMAKVMANYPKAFGEPAKAYARQLAMEIISGLPCGNDYQNEHMQRGHEQEPIAIELYEEVYMTSVRSGGYFDFERYGISPDGITSDGGLIEVKSVIPHVQAKNLISRSIGGQYKWQWINNLITTEAAYIDCISYCYDAPPKLRLMVERIEPKDVEPAEINAMQQRRDDFIKLVDKQVQLLSKVA